MNKIIQGLKHNYKWALIIFHTGILVGWLVFHPRSRSSETVAQEQVVHEDHGHEEGAAAVWTCSMHPQIRQDKPGQCPICAMDLIPLTDVSQGNEVADPGEIQMTTSAAQLANVLTYTVSRGDPEKTLYLQGKVQADERRIAELTARFGGRIEKLFVSFTGEQVRKGQQLATIYSPELVTAQRELIEAFMHRAERPALYAAARSKLKLWDLTDEQVDAIETEGEPRLYFDVLAPISGTVTRRHVTSGDYVDEGSPLFEVTDLSFVWIMFDAYESDLPWINRGDRVTFTLQSLPGKEFNGRISYIDPFIDPSTRVLKVRVEQENRILALKPEMFVTGVFQSRLEVDQEVILIPRSAVLWTGKRSVVYVKVPGREQPTFRYREIMLGPESGEFYVVVEGLQEGEEIAVNGVFKIDAAAQLAGRTSMMNPSGNMGKSMQVPIGFNRQLQAVYDAYLLMKNAFVTSDPGAVSRSAGLVRSSLEEVDMGLLEGASHRLWMGDLDLLKGSITEIVAGTVIEDQRLSFAAFNDAFYESVKRFGLNEGTVFYQYCPMANGDQGAFWLSEIKEIKNPYFGDAMLSCGETRETMEF